MQQLQIMGEYQIVCIYQSTGQTGEQVFVYENRLPVTVAISVPDGLQELDGIMSYYQNLTAQVIDPQQIQISGSGVFCTLPQMQEELADLSISLQQNAQSTATTTQTITQAEAAIAQNAIRKESNPSVVNKRGSRRETLSKYMRDLNNSVETPTSIRNFEIGAEHLHNE